VETATMTEGAETARMTLQIPWRDAASEIHHQLKIGRAIRNQRLRDRWELDQARTERTEWVRRNTELLTRIFVDPAVAEQSNEYVGTVLPEYAEFGLFVNQFEEEMQHRLHKLQALLKHLDTLPQPDGGEASAAVTADAAQSPAIEAAAATQADATAQSEPKVIYVQKSVSAAASERPAIVTVNVPTATGAGAGAGAVSRSSRTATTVRAAATAPAREERYVMNAAASEPSAAGALIVAGPEEASARPVSEFLTQIGLAMTVINRQSSSPRSIMDELSSAAGASFAVVFAGAEGLASGQRLFDLGYCMGRLGQAHVCIVTSGSAAPADANGIAHVSLDAGGGWQLQLARHLKRSGVPVDLNKLC
jgi:predicted nucleotide-binding protein